MNKVLPMSPVCFVNYVTSLYPPQTIPAYRLATASLP